MRALIITLAALGPATLTLYATGCGGDDCTQTLTCKRPDNTGGSNTGGAGGSGGTTNVGGTGQGAGTQGGGGAGTLPDGATCTDEDLCTSGFCVDGVCCETACDGLCAGCAVAGSEGACSPHAEDTDPEAECLQAVCDGAGSCDVGKHRWSTKLDHTSPYDGAVDGTGNVYVAMNDDLETHLVRLSSNGNELWSRTWTNASQYTSGSGIGVFSGGDALIVGRPSGTLSLGGTATPVTGQFFVARVDQAGSGVWAKAFNATGTFGASIKDATVGASDVIGIIGGFANGDLTLDTAVLSASGSQGFWASLSSTGTHLHSGVFQATGASDNTSLYDIAINPTAAVALIGRFNGAVTIGSDSLATSPGSDHDYFVVRVSAAGSYDWARRINAGVPNELNHVLGVSITDAGQVLVSGRFEASIDFGAGPENAADGRDFFVAKYDTDGTLLWSRVFGGAGDDEGKALFDDDGYIIVTGHIADSVDLGGGMLTANGTDVLVAKLDADGNHVWSRLHGGAGEQRGEVIGLAPNNDFIVAGPFAGTIDFGGGALTATGTETFVTRLGP